MGGFPTPDGIRKPSPSWSSGGNVQPPRSGRSDGQRRCQTVIPIAAEDPISAGSLSMLTSILAFLLPAASSSGLNFEPVTSIRHCAVERRYTAPLTAAAIRTAAHNGLTHIASPQPSDFYCGIIRLPHCNTVILVVLTQEKHRRSIPFSSNVRRRQLRIIAAAVGCVARGQRPQDSDLRVFVTGG
jgi:hypothetical protein